MTRRPQTWCPSVVLVDEPRFPIEGARRLVAVILDPKGERLDLCLSDPGFDWGGWFTVPAQRGVRRA